MPKIIVTNDAKTSLVFQVEPECHQFSIDPGESVDFNFEYDEDPPELRVGAVDDPVYGAVFPGDGRFRVVRRGETIIDVT